MKEEEIAAQVQTRAKELLGKEEKKPLEPTFIKSCLDANERGDGVLFATLHRDDFRLNTTQKDHDEWYVWKENVWEIDHKKQAFRAVEDVAMEYQRNMEALQQEIDEEGIDKKHEDAWKLKLRDKYHSRINKLRSGAGQKSTLFQAPIVEPSMLCQEHDFDKNPWLLPVRNGVINLKTGVLEQGRHEDLLRKSLDIDYNPYADSTVWEKFIEEISENIEIARFIKRSFGYAITGHSFEQFIWVFLGPGRNGKGKMFSAIADVMGPYFHEISKAMILERRNDESPAAASEHKYSLMAKRILVGAETNKGERIDEAAVKRLTGQNIITCRPNFKSEISFNPTHTLFLETNNIPYGLTKTFAIKQRLLLIEFPFMYVDDVEAEKKQKPGKADRFRKKDPYLENKLHACREGILKYLVEGCLEWQQMGIAPPQSIIDNVNNMANEEDYTGQFMEDCLVYTPFDEKTTASSARKRMACTRMYDTFKWWWSQNMNTGEKNTPAMKTINATIREKGYLVEKSGGKTWLYDYSPKLEMLSEVDDFLSRLKK